MIKFNRLFCKVIIMLITCKSVIASDCKTYNKEFDRGEVVRSLRSGGFSGKLNQAVQLDKIGNIQIGEVCFDIFTYSYTPKSNAGAIHMTKRLLILSDSKYIGMYSIDEFPTRVEGKDIIFPASKEEGNTITFDDVSPPSKVYLDGEVRKLYK